MIESIEIKNFQAHKHLKLDFSEGLNVIAGSTDVGKSSIVRALLWVMTNKPQGLGFIRWGTKAAEVTVVVDGVSVTRKRGKSVNTYHIDDAERKAFGTKVPDDIAQLFNVNEVNIQKQFDSPFWFNDSAGQVSKQLNQVVNLDIIDRAFTLCGSKLKKAKTEKEYIEVKLAETKKEVKELEWVAECSEDLGLLVELNEKLEENKKLFNSFTELIKKTKKQERKVLRYTELYTAGTKALSTASKMAEIKTNGVRLKRIIELSKECIQQSEIKIPDISSLGNILKELTSTQSKMTILDNIISNGLRLEKDVQDQLTSSKKASEDFKQLQKGKCPLCEK